MSTSRPKTAFEEMIEVVMEISRSTLPFLAARGDGSSNNMMMIMLVPFMMMILRRIQMNISNKIKPSTLIVHESYRGDLTPIYKTIKNYLLINYAEKFDLTCGYNFLVDDEGDDIERQNVDESDIPSGIYTIIHNGATIGLEVSSDKSTRNDNSYNTIKLSHRSKDILKGFVKDAKLDEKQRAKPIVAKERVWLPVYNWVSQWSSMQIRVTKKRANLFLEPGLDAALFNDIDKFLESEKQYLARGLVWKRGYLFYGTPGCGKTSTGLVLAEYTGRVIYRIKVNQILSSTEFDKACRQIDTNGIVILEEIDTIAVARSQRKLTTDPERLQALAHEFTLLNTALNKKADKTLARNDLADFLTGKADRKIKSTAWDNAEFWDGKNNVYIKDHTGSFAELLLTHLEKTLPSLAIKYSDEVKSKDKTKFAGSLTLGDILTALDGNDCFYGCIIIATTNYPDRLDAALKRPGRIDMECNFKPANAEVIRAIYETYLGREPGFEIPHDAAITQSKLIHEYILTYEHEPEILDQKLQEYFVVSANPDDKIDTTHDTDSPVVETKLPNSRVSSPIISRNLSTSSFDLLTDTTHDLC